MLLSLLASFYFKLKMKAIILIALFAIATARHVPGNIVQEISSHGYPVTPYEVTTKDGYILSVYRIPYGVQNKNQQGQSRWTKDDNQRPAVLLMHGMLSDSEDYVMGGPTEGLAYVLADNGFDVYLGNCRGSKYGQKHTTLDPKKDAAFWKFDWEDMGVKDLPAIIDKVLEVSQQDKIVHIGHNEGATSFYVLTSQVPEYNNKIKGHISLGPLAFMNNAQNPIIEDIVQHLDSKQWIVKNVGMNTFNPSDELVKTVRDECKAKRFAENICSNDYFLLYGYSSKHLNETTAKDLLERLPSYGSVREVFHYAYLKSTGRFQQWSEDSSPEDYDLSQISVPVEIFYTPNDPLANVKDVQTLADKLQRVNSVQFDELTNNLDLLYSNNVRSVVYEKIIEVIKNDNWKKADSSRF